MKKLLLLTLTLAMAAACLLVGNATANADALTDGGNTVLLAPSSICADKDALVVADNVDGGTILHIFSSEGLKSLNVSGETSKIRISGGKIYLLQKNKILVCDISSGQSSVFVEQEGVCDFDVDSSCLYFRFKTADVDRVYFKRLNDADFAPRRINDYNNRQGMKLCLMSASPNGGINLFYLANEESYNDYFVINDSTDSAEAPLSEPTEYQIPAFKGAVPCMNTIALFDSGAIYALDGRYDGLEFYGLDADEAISDLCFVQGAAANEGVVYLLTDKRLVLRFELGFSTESGEYFLEKDQSVEIGTTENHSPIPEFSIEAYVTATVEGYPSNIVYTAQALGDENLMLSGMLEPDNEILILNFDDDESDYYYIFDIDQNGNGKFGWIKKSERIKIVAVNEIGSQASVLPFSAFVYPFPCSAKFPVFGSTTSLSRADQVTLLKSFDDDWYFVRCGDGNAAVYGFMLKTSLGVRRETPEYSSYTRYSANPKAGKTLAVFSDAALSSALTDENGREIKLRANHEVRVYEKDENTAKVCVEIDGVYYRGFVSADGLMPYRGRMTNAQALGLALLIVVVLATVLIIILRIRKKRELKKQEETERL